MKPLQNTLYVTTPESYLFLENEAVAVKIGGVERVRVPLHTLESIVCFGQMTVSTPLISACGKAGVGLSFLSENGAFFGRVQGPQSGNVLLRRAQHCRLDDPAFSLHLARDLTCGKLLNSKTVLLRSARERDLAVGGGLRAAARQLAEMTSSLAEAEALDSVRGIEGAAGNLYFSKFDEMLHTRYPELRFRRRSRRPPENEVNAVLSFLYALLKNDMQAALESVGLDPAVGFMHTLRPGRPALALDLMEELRSPLCDRLTLSLFNRGQLTPDDFSFDTGGCTIADKARKTIIESWQARKREEIEHLFLREKIQIGLIPFVQAQLLARVLRGELDRYPPFIWR